jgi:hypothetical protein
VNNENSFLQSHKNPLDQLGQLEIRNFSLSPESPELLKMLNKSINSSFNPNFALAKMADIEIGTVSV